MCNRRLQRVPISTFSRILLVAFLIIALSLVARIESHEEDVKKKPITYIVPKPLQFLRQGSNTSLSAELGERWNVECGDQDLCPSDYPVCCGLSGYLFCVSGGQKCCQSSYNPGQFASCGVDEECCPSFDRSTGFPVDCCKTGESCWNGQCTKDPCSNTSDPNFCLTDPQCEWCCGQRKCQSKNQYALCDTQILSYPGQSCEDPCTLQARCNDCISSQDHYGGQCAWCCQSQSCMTNVNQSATCNRYEIVTTKEQCVGCGPEGHGVHVKTSYTYPTLPVILIVSAICCLICCVGICARVIAHRRWQREMAEAEAQGLLAPDGRIRPPQVRKYGFGATTSDEEKKRKREESENPQSRNKEDADNDDIVVVVETPHVAPERILAEMLKNKKAMNNGGVERRKEEKEIEEENDPEVDEVLFLKSISNPNVCPVCQRQQQQIVERSPPQEKTESSNNTAQKEKEQNTERKEEARSEAVPIVDEKEEEREKKKATADSDESDHEDPSEKEGVTTTIVAIEQESGKKEESGAEEKSEDKKEIVAPTTTSPEKNVINFQFVVVLPCYHHLCEECLQRCVAEVSGAGKSTTKKNTTNTKTGHSNDLLDNKNQTTTTTTSKKSSGKLASPNSPPRRNPSAINNNNRNIAEELKTRTAFGVDESEDDEDKKGKAQQGETKPKEAPPSAESDKKKKKEGEERSRDASNRRKANKLEEVEKTSFPPLQREFFTSHSNPLRVQCPICLHLLQLQQTPQDRSRKNNQKMDSKKAAAKKDDRKKGKKGDSEEVVKDGGEKAFIVEDIFFPSNILRN